MDRGCGVVVVAAIWRIHHTTSYQIFSYIFTKFYSDVCISHKMSLAILNDIVTSSMDKNIRKYLEKDNESNPIVHNNL